MEELQELFKQPGWEKYLNLLESDFLVPYFMELMGLEPTKAENFVKFVELKSKIDMIKSMTYYFERQVVKSEDVGNVDISYGQRFISLIKKLWRS